MLRRFSTVLYDFDFTLADSSLGVVDCVNYALNHMGFPTVANDHVLQTVGLSLPATFKFMTTNTDPDLAEIFQILFIERADQVMAVNTHLFPYVPHVIQEISQNGFAQGIVSSKLRRRIEEITTRDGIRDYFSLIVGGEDCKVHKPEPQSLCIAMRCLECVPESTVYVGDHWVDAEAAARAGVSFVGVLTGRPKPAEFARYPFYAVIDDLSNLPELLGIQADGLH